MGVDGDSSIMGAGNKRDMAEILKCKACESKALRPGTVTKQKTLVLIFDLASEKFGNLNGIQCGALFHLISNDPECEGIWENLILADPSYETVILPRGIERDGVES